MWTLIFGRMVVQKKKKKKKKIKVDNIFLSNGRVEIREINE